MRAVIFPITRPMLKSSFFSADQLFLVAYNNRDVSLVLRAALPHYLLDFGFVILGTIHQKLVRITNTGWFPCSFNINHEYMAHHGFSTQLEKVRNLPGAPDHETVDFTVNFDPRGANLELGTVETVLPINVSLHLGKEGELPVVSR